MDFPQPQAEHKWLQKLVGEWTYEGDCSMGPDQPPSKMTGTETVRSLGGLWTIGEGTGGMPGGGTSMSVMTLGYDPVKQKFVGTFIASVMTHLWPYEGTLDASGRVLSLDSEGPDFSGGPKMAKYQDVIEFLSDDHRTLSSHLRDENGQWVKFMTMHYRRKATK
jgi:hypothetical protein